MRNTLTFLIAMLCVASLAREQKAPTKQILPKNVVQESIQYVAFSTNTFAVRWTYTKAGAKKALASWEADGSHYGMTDEWKKGWLKNPTHHEFFHTEAAATEFLARLKKK